MLKLMVHVQRGLLIPMVGLPWLETDLVILLIYQELIEMLLLLFILDVEQVRLLVP